MNIRKATEQDKEIITLFGNKVLEHHQSFDSFYKPVGDGEGAKMESEKISFIALNDENAPVGYIAGLFNAHPADRSMPFAVVQGIWVEESARGGGIAQQLLQTFESVVQDKGAKQIDLFVDIRNTLGLHLWDASGYKLYQEKRRKLL